LDALECFILVRLRDQYGSFDQDLAAREKRREMLTEDLGFRRGRTQEVDDKGIPEVLGNREGVDNVQGIETKMMARQGPWEFPAARVAHGWRFMARWRGCGLGRIHQI
jgi:hypothetical protein